MRPRSSGARLAPGYDVVAHLARGRKLDVYDVWSDERRCRCIAKVLRPDRRQDAGSRRRLLHEGRLLQDLCHPGIVRGYETLSRPEPVAVMETLGGATVAHLVETRQRLTAREVAFLGLHLASAVHYLHAEGYLHLDLKPSNVVAENGRAKVIDLSLARRPGRARAGAGTWCYMAPEQARGGQVGPATDVWGLGVVLYEAAAGETPFGDETVEYPQLEHRAPPLRTVRPRLPRGLADAVDASLEPQPETRPSVDELSNALRPVAGARG